MPIAMRYGTLPRKPWESPAWSEVGQNRSTVAAISDPAAIEMPAGAPTELYRGPRYEKPVAREENQFATTQYRGKWVPGVPTVGRPFPMAHTFMGM